MIALISAVFIASLVGSLHCAGMCGAFAAFATALDSNLQRGATAKLNAAYNLGRLTTYTALGVIAGAFGGAFDMLGDTLGVQRVMALVAGLSMVVFGAVAILRLNGVKLPRAPIPAPLRNAAMGAHRFAADRPPVARALITGLATTLLPCGWLYAFVLLAAGTGSWFWGGVTMAVFWTGTLPVMLAIGVGVRQIAGRLGGLGSRVPVITAMVVVVAGLFTVMGRAHLTIEPPRVYGSEIPDQDELVTRAEELKAGAGEVCHEDDAHGSSTIPTSDDGPAQSE